MEKTVTAKKILRQISANVLIALMSVSYRGKSSSKIYLICFKAKLDC